VNEFPLFLLIYGSYDFIQCALIQQDMLGCSKASHKDASKNLIVMIDELLKNNHKKLKDCSFIAVHQGPAPYTTLRTVIATANGLSFATKIPLVGLNGLETLLQESHNVLYDYTIVLLNAFSNDVYYGIYDEKQQKSVIGCNSFQNFLAHLETFPPSLKIQCVGNAALAYQQQLLERIPFITFPVPFLLVCSLQGLIKQAEKQWSLQENITQQLMPLYLKASL
jgi:tRNA threonylcarbamoyladenosine biosynthesis protein TsaB